MHAFADLAELQQTLDRLIERRLVERLQRRPGQKEERYRELLGGEQADAPDAAEELALRAPVPQSNGAGAGQGALAERVARLEREVAELRGRVEGTVGGVL
jgi:uncharacterized protein YceH (UPF0502 family)